MSDAEDATRSALIEAILQHDFAVYDGALNFKWSPTGSDILQRLRASRTFLVDNNVSWKSLAQSHGDVNFVIGATVSEEANDLEGVLFSRMPTGGYANVFAAELTVVGTPRVVFNRLDERYRSAVFARPIQTLQDTPAEHRVQQEHAASALRFQLALNLSRSEAEVREEMLACVSRSRDSFFDAAQAAMLATVLMLQGSSANRLRNKLDPGYVQLPGDTRLVAEALFYSFPVISNDTRGVHTLGGIVGASVTKPADFPQSGGNAPIAVPTI